MTNKHRLNQQAGQAVIFILLALVTLVFFLLFIVDLHQIVRRKNQTMNAGDARRWLLPAGRARPST